MITSQTIKTPQGLQTNYFVTRQDYWKISINLAKDITGQQIDMTIRKDYDTSILLAKTATILDALIGTAEIEITTDDTPIDDYENLTPGKYKYDIQLKTTATNGDRETFQFGEITILDHITTT